MKDFFKELFEYTYLFNEKVIDSLIDAPQEETGKSIQLLNHTINAHEIWNSRIEDKPCSVDTWQVRPIDVLQGVNLQNYNDSLRILEQFKPETLIRYTNTKGQQFENSVKDILFHITNHSTYHRGQIAADCKLNGMTALVTDYIIYKRETQ